MFETDPANIERYRQRLQAHFLKDKHYQKRIRDEARGFVKDELLRLQVEGLVPKEIRESNDELSHVRIFAQARTHEAEVKSGVLINSKQRFFHSQKAASPAELRERAIRAHQLAVSYHHSAQPLESFKILLLKKKLSQALFETMLASAPSLHQDLSEHTRWLYDNIYRIDYPIIAADVLAEDRIARFAHGIQHVSRVALYIPVLVNLYKNMVTKKPRNLRMKMLGY